MTIQPLPSTPYSGPILSPAHGIHPLSFNVLSPLKRRPHTRMLQSVPSSGLPPVSEEDEGDLADKDEPQGVMNIRPRRRPQPLIPLRPCPSSGTPLTLEIPETFQDQVTKDSEPESLTLSPSTLLARRRSQTTLDFPLPPTRPPLPCTFKQFFRSLSTPTTPPRHSPTPSHNSFASTSTDDSSSPVTPASSEKDDNQDFRSHLAKESDDLVTIEDFAQVLDLRFPRPFGRSASVVSLRSFNTAEFDEEVEPIYHLTNPRQAPPVPVVQAARVDPVVRNAQAPREECLQVPMQNKGRSPRLVLSVLDTTHGGSFDVPLVLGSFLSPPSSPCSPNSDDGESDYEGIPMHWSDSEPDDGPFGAALSSSEDEMSDDEAPSRALDPVYRTGANSHGTSSDGGGSPQLPLLQRLDFSDTASVDSLASSQDSSDTPSVYSVASHSSPDISPASSKALPRKWSYDRPLPRESLVPSDISSRLSSTPSPYHHYSPSSQSPQTPELRSRFSTSTLASIPDPPTSSSSKQAFFARLTGRTKPRKGGRIPFSPTHEHRSLTSNSARGSAHKRGHIPASPALSAFSFSTRSISSHSSVYSTDSGSCSGFSEESSGSTGLRRPPIPLELFLRG